MTEIRYEEIETIRFYWKPGPGAARRAPMKQRHSTVKLQSHKDKRHRKIFRLVAGFAFEQEVERCSAQKASFHLHVPILDIYEYEFQSAFLSVFFLSVYSPVFFFLLLLLPFILSLIAQGCSVCLMFNPLPVSDHKFV